MQVDSIGTFEGPVKTKGAVRPHRVCKLFRVARRVDPHRIDLLTEPPKGKRSYGTSRIKMKLRKLTR